MTDPDENGGELNSQDLKKIATVLLVIIAALMLLLLVKNCATGGRKDTPSNPETAELIENSGYGDRYEDFRNVRD